MGLSSNSLIHLTKSKDALIGILKEGFRIKYCLENIGARNIKVGAAFPMVSFCDIPLSEIKNHIENYGDYGVGAKNVCYGIGLKKEWGKSKRLNPVLYVDRESNLGHNYLSATQRYFKEKEEEDIGELGKALLDMFRYMKNYEGDLIRNGVTKKNYRFSDEREWRYVPIHEDGHQPLINTVTYNADKESCNAELSHLRLSFDPNDISYIIVNSDSEISDFIRILQDAKAKKYSYEDVNRLTTRIITIEQILADF
jgi:hypothetical protein